MTQYFHVWVRSERYRGTEPLTYQHHAELMPGAIVRVPLRDEVVLGFVVRRVSKPRFAVKPIAEALPLPTLPDPDLKLAAWLLAFYASPLGVITQLFLPQQLRIRQPGTASTQSTPNPISDLPPLTATQQEALARISAPDTYTLHGRTGSGKTRLYIELARQSLAAGKSVLILCPEIGLTSQLAGRFREVFGSKVVTLHSHLTAKEREVVWLQILQAEYPVIVIGPRSALFSPIAKLGLIVVDESHDQAYKQEQPPYYQAVRVASQLRALHEATLILGSATPAVADYYVAETRHKPIIRLSTLAKAQTHDHQLTIVDLKDRTHFSRSPHLSNELIQSVSDSLARGEQALLYLNRRGTARVTLCSDCGWQALCPHCDLPLTYHNDTFQLRCHTCGHTQTTITTCPSCGKPSVAFRSFGTKAIVSEVQRLLPDARIMRFDTDSAKDERLEQQYDQILAGNVDILVGTQILAKGLDLPRLSTLGILLADSSLYLPDYTAQERTYQLLTQVIGRVGRGHVESRAVIQTYYPESPLLHAALSDDWENFYNGEITERKRYAFPPFYHLLKLSCRRASASSAEDAMEAFKQELQAQQLPLIIDGPAPAFHEKIGGKYQWQLVLKARNRPVLLEALKQLPKGWSYDLDPADLL